MKKLKRIIAYIFRIDVFNRILVFISMALFMVVPSIVLYNIKEITTAYSVVMPCIVLLGALIGTGCFALYKPTRIPLVYFAEMIFILVFFSNTFLNLPTAGMVDLNQGAVFWCEIAYCILGAVINLGYFLRVVSKRINYKYSTDEDTNNDNPADFISAEDPNEDVEKDLKKIAEVEGAQATAFVRNIKLSRFMRLVSYFVSLIAYIYYLINSTGSGHIIFSLTVAALVISSVLLVASFALPKDYKYVYYYNQLLFEVGILFVCSNAGVFPAWIIASMAVLFVSFLLTMIVEGRRWMGATNDQNK